MQFLNEFIQHILILFTEICLLLLLSHFSRVRLCATPDGSPPGSPFPGILQARTLEWVAISFSNAWKWKVKVKSLNLARLLATPWTAAYQAPPSMGFSRQEYWSGVPLPSPRDLFICIYLHGEIWWNVYYPVLTMVIFERVELFSGCCSSMLLVCRFC